MCTTHTPLHTACGHKSPKNEIRAIHCEAYKNMLDVLATANPAPWTILLMLGRDDAIQKWRKECEEGTMKLEIEVEGVCDGCIVRMEEGLLGLEEGK